MLEAPLVIRDAQAGDDADWRRLWLLCDRFSRIMLPDEVTWQTWARSLDAASPVFGPVAARGADLTGFAAGVIHEGTSILTPVCYHEDLVVAPPGCGAGTGLTIVRELLSRPRTAGWSWLYRRTRAGDDAARRLYDRFCCADDFVRDRLVLD